MRIEAIDLRWIHGIARDAVDAIVNAAERAGQGLDAFYEDQLVHEIGYAFRRSASGGRSRLFTYFKFPYFGGGTGTTDILAEGIDSDGTRHCVWIEVKFRKRLCERQWRQDLDKLRKPRKRVQKTMHHGYWVYLYDFQANGPGFAEHFGADRTWKRRKTTVLAEFLQCREPRKKLGKTLESIDEAYSGQTRCSVIPSLCLPGKYSSRSAVLVTAQAQ